MLYVLSLSLSLSSFLVSLDAPSARSFLCAHAMEYLRDFLQSGKEVKYPVFLCGGGPACPDEASYAAALKQSFVLFTYRQNFVQPLPRSSVRSDKGWGCLIRTSQMLLARALLRAAQERAATTSPNCPSPAPATPTTAEPAPTATVSPPATLGNVAVASVDASGAAEQPTTSCASTSEFDNMSDVACGSPCVAATPSSAAPPPASAMAPHGLDNIVSQFFDVPDAAYSIHNFVAAVAPANKPFETDFWSPSQGCDGIRLTIEETGSPLSVYVSSSELFEDEVRNLLRLGRPMLILMPLRCCRSDRIHQTAFVAMEELMRMRLCLGIIGGVPRKSYFFIGVDAANRLVYLDPHAVTLEPLTAANRQSTVPHPRLTPAVGWQRVDSSMTVAFYLRANTPTALNGDADFVDLLKAIETHRDDDGWFVHSSSLRPNVFTDEAGGRTGTNRPDTDVYCFDNLDDLDDVPASSPGSFVSGGARRPAGASPPAAVSPAQPSL